MGPAYSEALPPHILRCKDMIKFYKMKLSQQKLPIYDLSWVNFVRLVIYSFAARDERGDKQQNYRAHHRCQQCAECACRNPAP